MKEALDLLIALQEIDLSIVKRNEELKSIPLEINKYTTPLKKAEYDLEKEHDKLRSIEKKKTQKEIELQEIDDRIEKHKTRTADIKSNKEYQAHLKEIERAEKERSHKEDEVLNLMEEVETVSGAISEKKQRIKTEKDELASIKATLDQRSAEIEKELDELKQKRSPLVEKINSEIYESYMNILQKTGGLAVAEAKDEVCLGCYMSIPPQLYVEIKSTTEILTCPQCDRFLYRKD